MLRSWKSPGNQGISWEQVFDSDTLSPTKLRVYPRAGSIS
jgi:hypothetical protein